MNGIFKKLKHFFFPKLNIQKLELKSFMGLLHMLQSNVSIKEIDSIYNIYSSPIYSDNYDNIIIELAQFKSAGTYNIEMGDFIGAYFIELKKKEDFLLIVKYTSNFEKEFYFFNTNKIPTFAIRKHLQYKDRCYYSIMNKEQSPTYISDKLFKKYNII